MKYSKKWFGTDGVRGVFGKSPMTPDSLVKLGYVFGQYLRQQNPSFVLMGHDPRASSDLCVSALSTGLLSAGIEVRLLGMMPTPAVAYLTRISNAAAGIVVSASHNPYTDNGVKFFNHQGFKLEDAIESFLENQWSNCTETPLFNPVGSFSQLPEAATQYIEFCKQASHHPNLSAMSIVLDCAHGAMSQIAPTILEELGAKLIVTGATPTGININEKVGATSPQHLQALVLEHQADIGIAFDGDGDRVILVDSRGTIRDGDDILYLLAMQYPERADIQGVVGTQMTNLALEHALRAHQITLYRAPVGDRHVLQMLKEKALFLGGESSGHVIDLGLTTTGDGLMTALQVLATLHHTRDTLESLLANFRKYPQVMINVPIAGLGVNWHEKLLEKQNSLPMDLAERTRVVVRPSGTEPVVRIMVEAETEHLARSLAEAFVQTAIA